MFRAGTLASLLLFAGLVGDTVGQEKLPPPVRTMEGPPPRPLPPGTLLPPVVAEPAPRRDHPGPDPLFGPHSTFFGTPIGPAGVGIAPAAQGVGAGTTTVGFPQFPVILPGLLTAVMPEAARPTDRFFFAYTHVHSFRTTQSQLDTGLPLGTTSRANVLNLNVYLAGLEKTFFNGRASVYARLPVLDPSSNVSGQDLDGIGDVNFGGKVVLWCDPNHHWLLTTGMTVSVPTGPDFIYPTAVQSVTFPGGDVVVRSPETTFTTRRLNPTYLQPWFAAQYSCDRFFVHNYFGVLIPTESEISTFINNNLTMGMALYRGGPGSCIRFISTTGDVQALIPITRRGEPDSILPTGGLDNASLPPGRIGFSDHLFVTGSTQVGLGDRTVFSFGITTPVVGPRAYQLSYTVGVSYLY